MLGCSGLIVSCRDRVRRRLVANIALKPRHRAASDAKTISRNAATPIESRASSCTKSDHAAACPNEQQWMTPIDTKPSARLSYSIRSKQIHERDKAQARAAHWSDACNTRDLLLILSVLKRNTSQPAHQHHESRVAHGVQMPDAPRYANRRTPRLLRSQDTIRALTATPNCSSVPSSDSDASLPKAITYSQSRLYSPAADVPRPTQLPETLRGFKRELHALLVAGLPIDDNAWARLLQITARHSHRASRLVVTTMRNQGLLAHDTSKQAVAQHAVGKSLMIWLRKDNETVASFFASCDLLWQSTGWLSTNAVNRMVDAVSQSGQFQHANDVLSEAKKRGVDGNVDTLNVLLARCTKLGNVQAAVAVMHSICKTQPNLRPDGMSYDLLFRLAWTRRQVNMLRVVWRYACMTGHVSAYMIRTMSDNLYRPLLDGMRRTSTDKQAARSRNVVFRSVAPKVAIGLARVSSDRVHVVSKSSDEGGQSSQDSGVSPNINTLDADKMLYATFRADLARAGTLQPRLQFSEALHKAYYMDVFWKSKGLRSDLHEMSKTAVDIPVLAVNDHRHESFRRIY